jgi:hypothetical protein
LHDEDSEFFALKAEPAPLNRELFAKIEAVFKIPVRNLDQVLLQFQVILK